MISKKQVLNIADLSRIEISDKEAKKFQKEFSDILDYFDLLKKAKVSSKSNVCFKKAELRQDKVVEFLDLPEKGKYIKVQKIYDN